jgi:hypothetical protein
VTGLLACVTRRVVLVEQELLTLPEHMGLNRDFSGIRISPSPV